MLGLNFAMYLNAFDMNGADGADGADEFAGTAAEASRGVDGGSFKFRPVLARMFDHRDGAVRAMSCAVAAFVFSGCGQAEVERPDGNANLRRGFIIAANGMYRASRADFGTARTLWSAEPALEVHFGLHERFEGCGRPQNIVGTFGDAELASCATRRKIAQTERPCGFDGRFASWRFTRYERCHAAVRRFIVCLSHACHGEGGQSKEEATSWC